MNIVLELLRHGAALTLPDAHWVVLIGLLGGVALAGFCIVVTRSSDSVRAVQLSLLGALTPGFPRPRIEHPEPVLQSQPDAPGRRLPRSPGSATSVA